MNFSNLTSNKKIYLADQLPETNSDEYTESLLWFYLFCDRIISSAKLLHICWMSCLFVFTPNLPHSSVYFRLNCQNSLKSDIHPCQCETQISCVRSWSIFSLNSSKRWKLTCLVQLISQLTSIGISSLLIRIQTRHRRWRFIRDNSVSYPEREKAKTNILNSIQNMSSVFAVVRKILLRSFRNSERFQPC